MIRRDGTIRYSRKSQRILAGTLGAFACVASIWGADSKKQQYERVVFVGADKFTQGDSCVNLTARMSSGGFFRGLEKIENSSGTLFKKKSIKVDEYPDSTAFDIMAVANRCSVVPNLVSPPPVLADLMKSAHFDAKCQTASESKSLVTSVVQRQMPSFGPTTWRYSIQIETKGCLLSGAMSVKMTSNGGIQIADFVAKL